MSLLFELFYSFFRIGLFSFGGGYAMIPLIQSEILHHGWLTAEQFAARVLRDNLLFGLSGESMALALVRLVLFGDRTDIEPLRSALESEMAEVANLIDNEPTLFN